MTISKSTSYVWLKESIWQTCLWNRSLIFSTICPSGLMESGSDKWQLHSWNQCTGWVPVAVALSSSDPAMLNHPNNPCDVIVVSYWQRTLLCLNLYIKIFPVMLQTKVTLVPLFICDLSLYKNYKTKRQHQHTHKYYFKKHIKLDKRYINMCILFFLYRFRRNKYWHKHCRNLRLQDWAGTYLYTYSTSRTWKL